MSFHFPARKRCKIIFRRIRVLFTVSILKDVKGKVRVGEISELNHFSEKLWFSRETFLRLALWGERVSKAEKIQFKSQFFILRKAF